ncbi:MAG: efflux RND transporter permease subunit, partial [Thermoleophilia bacterium]|nr:efflux RND transporter permease subunit [Thermoleophilia bacterium]
MRIAIFGGTGDLGRGLAINFAAAGHEIVVGSRSQERADQAAASLAEALPEGTFTPMENVQADPKFRAEVANIMQLQVRNDQGAMIRLGTVIEPRDDSGPVMILRYNLYSATAITGDAGSGTGSEEAMGLMRKIAQEELPSTMSADWTELGYLQSQAGNVALIGFTLSVVFVFLVLAAQYES